MKDMIAAIKTSDISFAKYFDLAGLDIKKGDFCVVEVKNKDYEEVGYVVGMEGFCQHLIEKRELPKIIRKATNEEIEQWKDFKKKEIDAMALCKEKVKKHNLNMKVTNVRFDVKNNKVVFNFIADKRVDFRELVKDLAAALKSRIDLWQIGVRDEAKMLNGFGICGQCLCCARYLKDFKPISIKVAKDQDIFVSPAKLSGVCGRLMCCLHYEHDHYCETNRTAPPIGATIETKNKNEGVVIERNLLNKTIIIEDAQQNRSKISFEDILSIRVPENLETKQKEILKSKVAGEEEGDDIPPDDAPAENNQSSGGKGK